MRNLSELNINEGGEPVARRGPSDQQIQAFESTFNIKLPLDYISLLRYSNGGHPEKDRFYVKGYKEDPYGNVDSFYFLDDDRESYGGLWRATTDWQREFSKELIPIANDGGDNQILLSFSTEFPTVKLWHHEHRSRLTHVADCFAAFIDTLSNDPDMI